MVQFAGCAKACGDYCCFALRHGAAPEPIRRKNTWQSSGGERFLRGTSELPYPFSFLFPGGARRGGGVGGCCWPLEPIARSWLTGARKYEIQEQQSDEYAGVWKSVQKRSFRQYQEAMHARCINLSKRRRPLRNIYTPSRSEYEIDGNDAQVSANSRGMQPANQMKLHLVTGDVYDRRFEAYLECMIPVVCTNLQRRTTRDRRNNSARRDGSRPDKM